MDLDEAKKLIESEEKIKQEEFLREYENLCKRYGYRIIPLVNLQLEKISN